MLILIQYLEHFGALSFWKFLVTYFLKQVVQMYVDFLGSFENIHFHV